MFVTGTTTGIWATRSFSGVLGTWYWSSGVSPAKSLWQLEARGMRAGATHTEITAGKLDHRWTSKPADVTTYGVNVTAQLTSWLLPIWAA
jgi:hypothetical protein